jgi:uncharacterized protein GlcG (DUF336 family)
VVHIAVTDRQGNVLGVFRMNDATRFSHDVAVQKSRTASFLSDDHHAFSTRAVGFVSQRFFPPGQSSQTRGPLFHLQNELSSPANLTATPDGPLRDGVTIFPGGFPLYKNGKLVGGIGISGDGVDQDDIIGFAGTVGFRPADKIRCDELPVATNARFLRSKFEDLNATFSLSSGLVSQVRSLLDEGLKGVRLPYVKFPRNPEV